MGGRVWSHSNVWQGVVDTAMASVTEVFVSFHGVASTCPNHMTTLSFKFCLV